MSLWYNVRPRNPNPTGKFKHHRAIGLERAGSNEHRGWSYQLIRHQAGATVSRTVFNVSISDASQQQTGYLQGYATAEQAGQAARKWIDTELL